MLSITVRTARTTTKRALPVLFRSTFLRALSTSIGARPTPSPSFNNGPAKDLKADINGPQALNKKHGQDNKTDAFIGLTGGQIFHEMMRRHNVDTIFGYPGGAILPVFDAIYNSKAFDFVLPRHEQGAGHMAEGYARATGKTGVILVTSGPGATNIITPLQDALSDGVPIVAFSGQVTTSAIGTDAFQEADVIGITRSCTKWNCMVKTVDELPKRINEAFEIANSGRPGPVLLDLPKDMTSAILKRSIPITSTLPSNALLELTKNAANKYQMESINKTASLLKISKKPVIYAGQGILMSKDGPSILKQFSEKFQIPVTTTLQALGSYDETNEKSLHMLGMHGSAYANLAIQNSDLILALGARFDDRVTGNLPKFAPEARLAALEKRGGIVHFEISPKNINKVVEADVAIEGDVTESLKKLLPLVESISKESRFEWLNLIKTWKKKYPFNYEKESSPNDLVKPQTLISEISRLTSEKNLNPIITTGVGQHQMWAAQHFRWREPRTMITSGGLGTMGFGLPAAIGAQVGQPNRVVIDIDGDASFNMTLTELSCAVQHNIPIKICILNNEEQGMVTQWQSLFYEDRFSHTHQSNPNFIKLADAMGLKGIRVSKFSELEPALNEWLDYKDGPVLLEVMVAQKVPVLPMVPAGKGLDEFMIYDKEVEDKRKETRHTRTNGLY